MDTDRTLNAAQRIAWLRLIRSDNVGPATFRALINRFGTAAAALDALPDLVRKGGARFVSIPSQSEAEDEIAALENKGGRMVAMCEPDYPPHLRHISGPPPLLSIIGGGCLASPQTVGIVGARNASAAGRRMAQILTRDLGAQGFVIVSGLARGIDAASHEAALETGTLAVMAGGLSTIYPANHTELAQKIVESDGTLISEMPFGWEARARDFPRRNRLVAGISLGIVVVEAAKRSGSLITARLALEQNREVFAVPGSPLDPRAEGGNALIRQGATLVTGADDIVAELRSIRPAQSNLFEQDQDEAPVPDGPPPGDDERAHLIEALSVTPTPIDLLIEMTGLPAGAVQMILLELELAGRIERSGNQMIALKG